MADFHLQGGQRFQTHGQDTSISNGTTFNVGGSNAKGVWTELVSAAANVVAAHALLVQVNRTNSVDSYLYDIGIGASGSEQVLIENIMQSMRQNLAVHWLFPLRLPAGTRVAIRGQRATAGTEQVRAVLTLLAQGFGPSSPFSRCTTWGADTADGSGAQVDPGATLNTKGAWSELVSAAGNVVDSHGLILDIGGQGNTILTNAAILVDVGVGDAGSEQVVIPDLLIGADGNADSFMPAVIGPLPVHIPAGTRVAVRAQCSINDAVDRLFDVVAHALS